MKLVEPNLYRYIWQNSSRDQAWMLIVILASMPTYFLSLDLPKRIVNGPIQGRDFENPDDTSAFLPINLPLPDWITGGPVVLFDGIDLERVPYLFALSLLFLALVAANGFFKKYINTYKGRMGERLLRRLRFQLMDLVLRYPLSRFRRTKPAEVASLIKDEVEPLGEFIGDAFTLPLFAGGQALTGLTFIFVQNVYLGFVTLFVVAVQAWLVPRMRRALIALGRQRNIQARQLAGRVGEIVESIQHVHVNDTSNRERAEMSNALGRLFFIRFEIYERKFNIKYINNLLIQFLAFLFYAAGGYLAIRGSLDIGQLVAVIAAYKDLPDPIRTLIDYDQKRLQVDAQYTQVIEQFESDEIQDVASQDHNGEAHPLKKGYEIVNLQIVDETGSKLIEKATATIGLGEQVAVIGAVNSGATQLAEATAGLLKPSSGRIELDNRPIAEMPEYVRGRRLAYLDGSTYFPQSTIYDTLTYVLKNRPVAPTERDDAAMAAWQLMLAEAKASGNSDLDATADWIDRERIGVSNDEELLEKIRGVLADVDMEAEVRSLGLRGSFDPKLRPQLAGMLLKARHAFREQIEELGLAGIVETFEPDSYNEQATIGENLLFGTATNAEFDPANLPANATVRKVLAEAGLDERLFALGREVAATTLELFGDLKADNPFFDQLNYMDAEELPAYRAALTRIANPPAEGISEADRQLILKLPFAYVESKNRLGLLDDDLKNQIVEARGKLRKVLETIKPNPVSFYDPDTYNSAANVIDNILLGRVSSTVAEAQERVTTAIRNLLEEMDMADDIFLLGLEFNMGSGGKRLSESQRQKLHLARCLLKRPDFLIVNQALNTLDGRTQRALVETILAKAKGRDGDRFGVIWSPMNPAYARMFERVLVFERGVLVADGKPRELEESSGVFRELVES